MKTTTNTTSTTKQLVAVFAADDFYIDGRGYTPHGHAFVNGIRFDDVTPSDVLDLVQSFEPTVTMTETAHHVTDDGYTPATTILFTVDQLETLAPVAETVTVHDHKTAEHVPCFIDIQAKHDRRFYALDDETLMNVYGMTRERRTAIFTYGEDKDATRTFIYRDANGNAYVQYHHQLMAIPESCVKPEDAPVTVSHVEPKPKQDTPKQDTPKRKHAYVVFNYNGNVYARKINHTKTGDTVNHDRHVWPLESLDCVSKHYTKTAAQKRVKQERKNAKRADKLTRKDEAPVNGNGCKHIPETYNGLVVDVQNGNIENIDRKTAWNDVKGLIDELVAAGIKLDCVTYERDYAWVIPSDRTDKFARDNHMVVSMTTKRGHSLKDKRRAWFVKCTK